MKEEISITRRFQFCAGHRVHLHESKCANPHGHNYILFATFLPLAGIDLLGRVIDFSEIKNILGNWINEFWDHGFIYYHEDFEMRKIFSENLKYKSYRMFENPTAENMAIHLVDVVCPEIFKDTNVICTKVTLWETENCYAEYERRTRS